MSPIKFHGTEFEKARDLMNIMVRNSQLPGEGNAGFVEVLSDYMQDEPLRLRKVADPEMPDRSLLIFDTGDPDGEQSLVAISHSDVVGVEGQDWDHDPWELYENSGTWIGRGVCDTHGSGVAMLLAAMRPGVRKTLEDAQKHVSIIFTYDEEATSPELSMRGARLAAGLLNNEPVATSKYFIAGEPTEFEGNITPMRGHKGRWLSHFTVKVEHSGHVSEVVQNALMSGASVVHQIGAYASRLTSERSVDNDALTFYPPHSTVQVSAAEIKNGEYSTTPSRARFTVDMRTLPDVHQLRVQEIADLVACGISEEGETISLEVVKDAEGSITPEDSPIVKLSEIATGQQSQGFNGGDEGRIMRLQAFKEGVTIGPGELKYAHMPNEKIPIQSVFYASDIYERIFKEIAGLDTRQTS